MQLFLTINLPTCCIYCRCPRVYSHGCYYRKANRGFIFNSKIGLIPIKRYRCTGCKRTFSVLPQCIAPYRWFIWDVQAMVLKMYVKCNSTWKQIALETQTSITTCKRWITAFESDFNQHYDILYNIPKLNLVYELSNFIFFWKSCLNQIKLQSAMLFILLSQSKVKAL